jgi:hypothetical protein
MLTKAWILAVAACASAPPSAPSARPVAAVAPSPAPHATSAGSTFLVPVGWTVVDKGALTVLTPAIDEHSHVVFVESTDGDPDTARDAALALYRPELKLTAPKGDDAPGRNGWQTTRQFTYEVPDRVFVISVAFGNAHYTVAILDLAPAVMDLRATDMMTIFDHLYPKK